MRACFLVCLWITFWLPPNSDPVIGELREGETTTSDEHGQVRWKSEAKPVRDNRWQYNVTVENYSQNYRCRVRWPAYGFTCKIPAQKTVVAYPRTPIKEDPFEDRVDLFYNGGPAPGEASTGTRVWLPDSIAEHEDLPFGFGTVEGTPSRITARVELYVERGGDLVPVRIHATSEARPAIATDEEPSAAKSDIAYEIVNKVEIEIGTENKRMKMAEFMENFDVVWYAGWSPQAAKDERLKPARWRGLESQLELQVDRRETRCALSFSEERKNVELRAAVDVVYLRQGTISIETSEGVEASILLPAYTSIAAAQLLDPNLVLSDGE